MDNDNNIVLQRIANHLILHSSPLDDVGLFHGKMGIILFFVHYARYTENTLYDDFACELLEEVCENISENLPVNLESGLCGIGWGIEYLIRNKFLDGDANEMLKEIDRKIMERDLRRIEDTSLATGLQGISDYIYERIRSAHENADCMPFDSQYLKEWKACSSSLETGSGETVLSSILANQPATENSLVCALGLQNGCAGYGLKMLLS